MSYILDALRKSESERRQGQVPDLGQQVQLIHPPRRTKTPVSVWVAAGLVLNAVVLAVLFWPAGGLRGDRAMAGGDADTLAAVPASSPATAPTVAAPETEPAEPAMAMQDMPETSEALRERPTIIVPTRNIAVPEAETVDLNEAPAERVPHLVELPLSFQRTVPDLVFNSHIYASDPAARRVMINNSYLRVGDRFSGIRVDRITEDGVELSKDGRRFRVGVVRDWVSPR
ncbi:general secretion pathway protein GspB [Marinobacter sp.]|uniref:general secretion pathway protein GspB n=1 Tax=Marinobacter sp. TaxID=50741 RepID=UPI0019B04AC2|nr:general secretion pathway protein GspB [Marinobacter sp.]MBD3656166.1 general secretion pathway protein GspB [Marinobacter sp.]